MEYVENNNVAFDFKIKTLRNSVIVYTKLKKYRKA